MSTLTEAETTNDCPNSMNEPFLTVAKALISEPTILFRDYDISFEREFSHLVNNSNTRSPQELAFIHGYVDSLLSSQSVLSKFSSFYSFATPKRQADYCLYVNRYKLEWGDDINANYWFKSLPIWLWAVFLVVSAVLGLASFPKRKLFIALVFLLTSLQDGILFAENLDLKADNLQKLFIRFPYSSLDDVANGLLEKKFRLVINVDVWNQLRMVLNGTDVFMKLERIQSLNNSQITFTHDYGAGCRMVAENMKKETVMLVLLEVHHMLVRCGMSTVKNLYEYRLAGSGIPPIYNAFPFSKKSQRYREIYSRKAEYFSILEYHNKSSTVQLLWQPLASSGKKAAAVLPIEALTELIKACGFGVILSLFLLLTEFCMWHKRKYFLNTSYSPW